MKKCNHTNHINITFDLFYWICLDCGFNGYGKFRGSDSLKYTTERGVTVPVGDTQVSFMSLAKILNQRGRKKIRTIDETLGYPTNET